MQQLGDEEGRIGLQNAEQPLHDQRGSADDRHRRKHELARGQRRRRLAGRDKEHRPRSRPQKLHDHNGKDRACPLHQPVEGKHVHELHREEGDPGRHIPHAPSEPAGVNLGNGVAEHQAERMGVARIGPYVHRPAADHGVIERPARRFVQQHSRRHQRHHRCQCPTQTDGQIGPIPHLRRPRIARRHTPIPNFHLHPLLQALIPPIHPIASYHLAFHGNQQELLR